MSPREDLARQLYVTWCTHMDRTDPMYEGYGKAARFRRRAHWDFLVDSQRSIWIELAETAQRALEQVDA